MTRGRKPTPLEGRFWAKVQKTEGCWLWTGAKNEHGYGRIGLDHKAVQATHTSWFLAHGYWPRFLCHSCDTPACVRPDHLFEGDHEINAADRDQKGRGKPFRGERIRGEAISKAKLTEAAVKEIRRLRSQEGLTQRELARAFGVHSAS